MRFAHLLISALLAAFPAYPATPKEQCFPVEDLEPADRQVAEEIFLKLMDGEGLYTVIGGIKPMSSGFATFRMPASALEQPELDRARRLLERFRCGEEIYATVQHFAKVYPNDKTKQLERSFEGVVFHIPSFRKALTAKRAYFAPLGLTPHTAPMEVLTATDFQENPHRLRGLGYLYGYPDYAVDWFVKAAQEQERNGEFVQRDFVSFPTHARAERGVVYAVPKGHPESAEDKSLRTRFASVLEQYRARREKFIGEGKPGIVALLRDWFCRAEACTVPAELAAVASN
jgi:hypothetical protein